MIAGRTSLSAVVYPSACSAGVPRRRADNRPAPGGPAGAALRDAPAFASMRGAGLDVQRDSVQGPRRNHPNGHADRRDRAINAIAQ